MSLLYLSSYDASKHLSTAKRELGYISGYVGRTSIGYPVLPLTVTEVRNAKQREKPYKLFDEKSLYLLVTSKGSKLWRFKYTFAKREKTLSIGAYPEITLAVARRHRTIARQMLAMGVDPSASKRASKELRLINGVTFEQVAKEWFEKFSPSWALSHSSKVIRRLERDIYPRTCLSGLVRDLLHLVFRMHHNG